MTSTDPTETIAHQIKRRMMKGQLNRMQLSQAARMTWQNLDAILRGLCTPTIPTLERIAAALTALGVPTTIRDLLTEP